MKKGFKISIGILASLGCIAGLTLLATTDNIIVLDPKGLIGDQQRDLINTSSLLMLIVVIPVLILNVFFAWRYRASNTKAKHTPDWEHNSIAECCWWGVPFILIIILSVITWKTSHELDPFKPIENGKKPLEIQVVALQWKWLFIYPEQGIATINYVQFPEKTPLNFEITADAPMNSFWIPQLGGQIYAMPAMRTKLHLIASDTGVFRGASANLSGKGFAGMTFQAVSTSEKDFESWIGSVKKSGKVLTRQEYERLVAPTEYEPPKMYVLKDKNLFDQIIMKYTHPSE